MAINSKESMLSKNLMGKTCIACGALPALYWSQAAGTFFPPCWAIKWLLSKALDSRPRGHGFDSNPVVYNIINLNWASCRSSFFSFSISCSRRLQSTSLAKSYIAKVKSKIQDGDDGNLVETRLSALFMRSPFLPCSQPPLSTTDCNKKNQSWTEDTNITLTEQ